MKSPERVGPHSRWPPRCFGPASLWETGRGIRPLSRMRTASISTKTATQRTALSPTAPSIGTPTRLRRYHSECHVCHGPNGDGSSYAPALTDSLKTMSYGDFLGVVASGRKNVNTANENVMPAFGSNKNVMCVVDDIFVYLRARANDALGRVRPAKHEDKPEAAKKWMDFLLRTRWVKGSVMTKVAAHRLLIYTAAFYAATAIAAPVASLGEGRGASEEGLELVRSECPAGLRRPEQYAVLQREGRRVRKQTR